MPAHVKNTSLQAVFVFRTESSIIELMYTFMSAKGRAEIRVFISGIMKVSALPLATMLAFALLLAALGMSAGLSGAEFFWSFIGETIEPVATTSGAVLLFVYLSAAMLCVLPFLWNEESEPGRFVSGLLRAVARRVFQSAVPWSGTPADTPIGLEFSSHLPPPALAISVTGPFSAGQNPQRE